jgi:hypothetical protein
MHCFIVFQFFLKYLSNAEHMISSRPFASKSTLMVPNNFLCILVLQTKMLFTYQWRCDYWMEKQFWFSPNTTHRNHLRKKKKESKRHVSAATKKD